jgi:hypothetical protein
MRPLFFVLFRIPTQFQCFQCVAKRVLYDLLLSIRNEATFEDAQAQAGGEREILSSAAPRACREAPSKKKKGANRKGKDEKEKKGNSKIQHAHRCTTGNGNGDVRRRETNKRARESAEKEPKQGRESGADQRKRAVCVGKERKGEARVK